MEKLMSLAPNSFDRSRYLLILSVCRGHCPCLICQPWQVNFLVAKPEIDFFDILTSLQ